MISLPFTGKIIGDKSVEKEGELFFLSTNVHISTLPTGYPQYITTKMWMVYSSNYPSLYHGYGG